MGKNLSTRSPQHFVWLDLEMTGLNPDVDRILEVACLITDKDFKILDSFEAIVFQEPVLLEGMSNWCKETHGKSGLIAKVANGISDAEADSRLVDLVVPYFKNEKAILCGNSIWQDRRFVDKYLPAFSELLHYRMLDVSSFKIVFQTKTQNKFEKSNNHRALDDVKESISELKYYLSFLDKHQSLY